MKLPSFSKIRFSRVVANDPDAAVKAARRRCTRWGALALMLLSISVLLAFSIFATFTTELFPIALFCVPFVYFCSWGASACVVKFVYHLRRFLALSDALEQRKTEILQKSFGGNV